MNKPLSIEVAKQLGFKARAKNFLGKAATIAFPQTATALADFPASEPSGILEKTLMSYLKRQAMVAGDEAFFERLHQDFWKGEGGQVFSSNCDHRFHDLFLNRQREDFLALQQIWDNSSANQIVEFGCNSGLLLNYMTQELWRSYRLDGN